VGSTDRVTKKTEQTAKGKTSAFVAAIGGISGAGKTVLVEKVTDVLGNAVAFYYDNYPNETPSDGYKWLREGLDLNLIKTPQFTEDLRLLKSGKPVTPPMNREGRERGRAVKPAPLIVVEEPFAGIRREVRGLIDLAVYINVPFEIALGRKWFREFPSYANELKERGEFNYDSFVNFIVTEMFFYLLNRRDEYVSWHNQALKNCDMVLDGMRSVDTLAEEVAEAMKAKSFRAVGDTNTRQKIALTTLSSIGDVLKSRPDAKEVIARYLSMSVDESELAMTMHMTVEQVALFMGWNRDKTEALLNDLNRD
jgi:uridine kinase